MRESPGELTRAALRPASLLWALVSRSRNLLYDRGIAKAHRLPVPVVSIGNITAGGTGKTPLAIYISGKLIANGARPLVLSRGYGSEGEGTRIASDGTKVLLGASEAGDEPILIARSVPRLPVIVDPDRVRGGLEAVRRFSPSVIILDDGFQHRRLARDLDIVLLDATDPFGRYRMLPSGFLREPLSGLARADLFVVTRAPGGEPLATMEGIVRSHNARAPIVRAHHVPLAVLRHSATPDTAPSASDALESKLIYAFCGIGNPESFRSSLLSSGARIAGFEAFRDHHPYSDADLYRLASRAVAAGASLLVTTEKDGVRIHRSPNGIPLVVLRVGMEIEDEQALLAPILALVRS